MVRSRIFLVLILLAVMLYLAFDRYVGFPTPECAIYSYALHDLGPLAALRTDAKRTAMIDREYGRRYEVKGYRLGGEVFEYIYVKKNRYGLWTVTGIATTNLS